MKWDLGGRHFVLGVLKAVKLSQGRLVELGMSLAEKTQLITLEAAVKPHKDHRLNATCAFLPLPLAALLLSGLEHARVCHAHAGAPVMSARLRRIQVHGINLAQGFSGARTKARRCWRCASAGIEVEACSPWSSSPVA